MTINGVRQELDFLLWKLKGSEISQVSMSGSALSQALAIYCRGRRVLEWGVGGSTFEIASICDSLISIESDKRFLFKQAGVMRNLGYTNAILVWADIGPTKAFGTPIRFLRKWKSKKYPNYYNKAFQITGGIDPEVVLIDGRFRVACAIKVVLNMKSGPVVIIVDDYVGRPEYSAISSFLGNPIELVGGAAIFKASIPLKDIEYLRILLREYENDSR